MTETRTAGPGTLTPESIEASIANHHDRLEDAMTILDNPGATDASRDQAAMAAEFEYGYLTALRHVRYAMTHDDWTLS